jgi:hypothetical protein
MMIDKRRLPIARVAASPATPIAQTQVFGLEALFGIVSGVAGV